MTNAEANIASPTKTQTTSTYWGHMPVPVGQVALPAGKTARIRARSHDGFGGTRQLNARQVRAAFGPVPRLDKPALLTAITDLSGSMWGGNDPLGLRHEALLIALEHIASSSNRRGWHFQMISFDLNTSLDLAPLPLRKKNLRVLRAALLGSHSGGTSNLGPSIGRARSTKWGGVQGITVMSDFLLFDMPASTKSFNTADVAIKQALVFGANTPSEIDQNTVDVLPIDPSKDAPDTVATHIWSAVKALAVESTAQRTT